MNKNYNLKVANIERNLPIIKVSEDLEIASFVILGDTELVCEASKELVKKIPKVDVLVTAEAKGIPLAFEISKLLGINQYIVARKSIKAYMDHPLVCEVESITTQKKQILCLDQKDVEEIKGKTVAIIDDVISTGDSIRAVEELVQKAGGIVKGKVCILAEGKAGDRDDIIFLEKLPVFPLK